MGPSRFIHVEQRHDARRAPTDPSAARTEPRRGGGRNLGDFSHSPGGRATIERASRSASEMMLSVDRDLNIVSQEPEHRPLRRHRAGIRIGQLYLLIRCSEHDQDDPKRSRS